MMREGNTTVSATAHLNGVAFAKLFGLVRKQPERRPGFLDRMAIAIVVEISSYANSTAVLISSRPISEFLASVIIVAVPLRRAVEANANIATDRSVRAAN